MQKSSQGGQALIEALILLGVLGSLAVGIAWTGRLQDVALQLTHASRRVAFAWSHQGINPMAPGSVPHAAGFSSAPGHRWGARQAPYRLLMSAVGREQTPLVVSVDRAAAQPDREPGDPVVGADRWRSELGAGDASIWRAWANARTVGTDRVANRVSHVDRHSIALGRHTAIMRGSGAAPSDAAAMGRLSDSAQAWSALSGQSVRTGRSVAGRVQGQDAAWSRPGPVWDWLQGWDDWVPQAYLKGATP